MTCAGLCPLSTWRGDNLVYVMPGPVNRKFSQGLVSAAETGEHKRKYPDVCPWFCCPCEQSLFQSVISETNRDRQFCFDFFCTTRRPLLSGHQAGSKSMSPLQFLQRIHH